MQEARKIEGIQNYPFIFIDQEISSTYTPHAPSIFDKDGNIIPISSTKDQAGSYFFNDIIITIEKNKDIYIPVNGFIGNIATREDEFVVLLYTYTIDCNVQTPGRHRMGFNLITNYGNIISGDVYYDGGGVITKTMSITSGLSGTIRMSGYNPGYNGFYVPDKSIQFIVVDLPPKECYVPQVFVDVIAIFLKHSDLARPAYLNSEKALLLRRELVQKFKELCYKFTNSGYNTKSKDEEIERLKSLLQERDEEIQSLKGFGSNLNRGEDEIDQLKRSLDKSRKNVKDLRDRLTYRLGENQKLAIKKHECTRIVRIYKKEVEELENEMANLKSILKVYNI